MYRFVKMPGKHVFWTSQKQSWLLNLSHFLLNIQTLPIQHNKIFTTIWEFDKDCRENIISAIAILENIV